MFKQESLNVNIANHTNEKKNNEPTKILVVEDDFVNVFIMKQILDNVFDTRYAKSGQEVMEQIRANDFQLILMDINLTEDSPNGVEIMKTLRTLPRYRNVGIFAVTGYHQVHEKEKFLNEGFDNFFTKPVQKEEILEAIKKALLEPGKEEIDQTGSRR